MPSHQPNRRHLQSYAKHFKSRTLLVAPGHTTRNKKLLGAKGIATRSKDATSDMRQICSNDYALTEDYHAWFAASVKIAPGWHSKLRRRTTMQVSASQNTSSKVVA